MIVLWVLAVWLVVSVPVAWFTGRFIRAGRGCLERDEWVIHPPVGQVFTRGRGGR